MTSCHTEYNSWKIITIISNGEQKQSGTQIQHKGLYKEKK